MTVNGRRSKQIRKATREVIRATHTDLSAAWLCLVACPWRARLVLAWRLARGVGMDGKKTERGEA